MKNLFLIFVTSLFLITSSYAGIIPVKNIDSPKPVAIFSHDREVVTNVTPLYFLTKKNRCSSFSMVPGSYYYREVNKDGGYFNGKRHSFKIKKESKICWVYSKARK